MKNGRLQRKSPLVRRAQMPRSREPMQQQSGQLRRTGQLQRTGRLRHRSQATERLYRQQRRPLVAEILAERPWCERQVCGPQRSTEVHELKSRARGGPIIDKRNCVALCHDCHHWITTHPAEAKADGWLLNSWEGNTVKVQGYCPMGCGDSLMLGEGGYVICSDVDCPNPDAVSTILCNRETEHVVTFDTDEFTILHPLRERLDEKLMGCDLHWWLAFHGEPPRPPGCYRARRTGGARRWLYTFEELPADGKPATSGDELQDVPSNAWPA